MARSKVDDTLRKVQTWLADEGLYRDKRPDETATYHYLVEFPPGSKVGYDIIQPKARDDLLVLASGINLGPDHYEGLKKLTKEDCNKLLWDIRFGLLFRKTQFEILPSISDVQRFQFVNMIYFDGLNKDSLMEALSDVHRCIIFVTWKMLERFGEAPPTIQPGEMYR